MNSSCFEDFKHHYLLGFTSSHQISTSTFLKDVSQPFSAARPVTACRVTSQHALCLCRPIERVSLSCNVISCWKVVKCHILCCFAEWIRRAKRQRGGGSGEGGWQRWESGGVASTISGPTGPAVLTLRFNCGRTRLACGISPVNYFPGKLPVDTFFYWQYVKLSKLERVHVQQQQQLCTHIVESKGRGIQSSRELWV